MFTVSPFWIFSDDIFWKGIEDVRTGLVNVHAVNQILIKHSPKSFQASRQIPRVIKSIFKNCRILTFTWVSQKLYNFTTAAKGGLAAGHITNVLVILRCLSWDTTGLVVHLSPLLLPRYFLSRGVRATFWLSRHKTVDGLVCPVFGA